MHYLGKLLLIRRIRCRTKGNLIVGTELRNVSVSIDVRKRRSGRARQMAEEARSIFNEKASEKLRSPDDMDAASR